MDQFIGTNAFVDDPVEKLKAVGFIREYHDWQWNESGKNYQAYPHNKIKWATAEWNFDNFYKAIKNAGIGISPCTQGNVKWLNKAIAKSSEKPLDEPGANADEPTSYQKKAHYMFQFAARYGSAKVPYNQLTIADNEPRSSGLNLVNYIEDWNEQDRDWEGRNANFTPQEYAAMASADYDGHANTMHMGSGTFGVKNADLNIKFVMGGLTYTKLDYVKEMKSWFEKNRKDKKFAADVINFHIYGWKNGKDWQGGGPALSPEESNFKERLEEITKYRDQNLPGVEVWVSEFGWDTNPESVLRAPAIGAFDIQEVQAQWLVRSYLAFAAAGVDRAQMFMFRDVDPNSSAWFSSCGLVGPKGDWTLKKSWYYVYTLKNVLYNMVFASEEPTINDHISVYKFKDIASQKEVYVVWANTSADYKVNDYNLKVSANFNKANLIEFNPKSTSGKVTNLKLNQHKVTVNVSERPIFIQLENSK